MLMMRSDHYHSDEKVNESMLHNAAVLLTKIKV
jgi:hypothetical protein